MEVATQQCRVYKAWSYVCEVDIQTTASGLLFQCLKIDVLHGFRGRIGWPRA